MPYKTVKQNCTRSDGKKGKYILKYKPKKPTKKKKDSQGFVKAGCHTSKKKAAGQRAAIEGGPINSGHELGQEKEQDQILEWLLETIEELGEGFGEPPKPVSTSTASLSNSSITSGEPGASKTAALLSSSDKPHLGQYDAAQGTKRDKHLDKVQKLFKDADKLESQGKKAEANKKRQKAYDLRTKEEKKQSSKSSFKNKPRRDTKKESVEITAIRNLVREVISENELDEKKKKKSSAGKLSAKTKATLKKKAEKRGFTPGSVYAEYRKGLAAWATSGSRKGMSQHQWAHARVNAATPSKPWAVVKKSKAKKKK